MNTTTELKITTSNEFMAELFGITPEIQQLQIDNFEIIKNKKIIKKLLGDIKKYPQIPQLKQQLYTAYQIHNMPKDVKSCAVWIHKEHPTYLFGKINMALEKYYEDDFEGMLEYLGKDLNLKKLLPERKEFHVDEVMNYFLLVALYRNATEPDSVQCDTILDIMSEIDSDHQTIEQAEIAIANFNAYSPFARKSNFDFEDKHPTTNFIQSILKSTIPPVFEISLFDDLYHNGFEIDQAIIRDILKLPQEVIKREFQKIINDSIARLHYFTDEYIKDLEIDEFEREEGEYFLISDAILHTIFILGETRNPDNLSLIFQIIRQGEQYCESYIGNHITEELWEIIYKLSDGREDELVSFLKEPNRYFWCKSEVVSCLEQIAIKQPSKKEFVINAAQELLGFFLLHKEDENILDTYIVSNLVKVLVNFKMEEHYPLIKRMFDENLVSLATSGNYNELIYFHNKNKIEAEERHLESIYEIYDELTDDYDDFSDNSDTMENVFDKYLHLDRDMLSSRNDEPTIELHSVRTEPKIGRNDDCPCGSGKKYKKCCLEKGIF